MILKKLLTNKDFDAGGAIVAEDVFYEEFLRGGGVMQRKEVTGLHVDRGLPINN